jgi:hypothetical protein
MSIFGNTDFIDYPVETAYQDTIGTGGTVSLILSDGTTTTIFDSIATALRCLNFMNSRKQYFMNASDDIIIVNVSGVKLLILETTFLNQKLLNSYNFIYSRGKVRGVHRNLSNIVNLTDALVSVGYKKNSTTAFNNNYDLETNLSDVNRPRIKIVDYHYISAPSNSTTGSLLEDSGLGIIYGN